MRKKPRKRRAKKGGWKSGVGGGDRPILIDKDEHASVVVEVAPLEFEPFPLPDAADVKRPATKRRKRGAAKRRT